MTTPSGVMTSHGMRFDRSLAIPRFPMISNILLGCLSEAATSFPTFGANAVS